MNGAVVVESQSTTKERQSPLPFIPEKCQICGAPWIGGCGVPGKRYPKAGLRVFFDCGASMSVIDTAKEWSHRGYTEEHDDGYCYFLRLKNCNSKDGIYVARADRDGCEDQPQPENDAGSNSGDDNAKV